MQPKAQPCFCWRRGRVELGLKHRLTPCILIGTFTAEAPRVLSAPAQALVAVHDGGLEMLQAEPLVPGSKSGSRLPVLLFWAAYSTRQDDESEQHSYDHDCHSYDQSPLHTRGERFA